APRPPAATPRCWPATCGNTPGGWTTRTTAPPTWPASGRWWTGRPWPAACADRPRRGSAAQQGHDRHDLRLPLQGRAGGLRRIGQRVRRVGAEGGMADLAPCARLLAVVVPVAAGLAEHAGRVRHRADPVEHAGMAAHRG